MKTEHHTLDSDKDTQEKRPTALPVVMCAPGFHGSHEAPKSCFALGAERPRAMSVIELMDGVHLSKF